MNKNLRIAIYNDWWDPDFVGGAERSAKSVFESLTNFYPHVEVFVPTSLLKFTETSYEFLHEVKTLSFRRRPKTSIFIKLIEKIRVYFDPFSPFLVAKAIKKFAPDVLVLHQLDRVGPYLLPVISFFIPNVKIVRVYHDLSDICIMRTRFRRNQNCGSICNSCKFKNTINKRFSRHIDFAIFNSNFTANKFLCAGYNPKANIVGYPFEFDNTKMLKPEKFVSSFSVGYVGRIHRTKGLEFLFTSASRIEGITVHVVGDGEKKYLKSLFSLAEKLDVKVVFHGYQDFPFLLLRDLGISVIIVPSQWEEPFGRIPLEAATYGIRTIAARSGGLPESVNLVEPSLPCFTFGEEDELAEIIVGALSNHDEQDILIKRFESVSSRLIDFLTTL